MKNIHPELIVWTEYLLRCPFFIHYRECDQTHITLNALCFDFHHLSTLSSIPCTYTPCSVCAHIYMCDEVFIHIHPKIDIHPFHSRSFLNTTCVPSCAYVYLIWRVHIYSRSIYLFSLQVLFALHTHYS